MLLICCLLIIFTQLVVKFGANYCDVVHCCDIGTCQGLGRAGLFAYAAGMRSCARAAGRRAVITPQVFLQGECKMRADARNLEKLSSGSIYSTFTANAIKIL